MGVSLASCGDSYFDDHFEQSADFVPADVVELDYTLTVADYGTIATNAVNLAIADSLDVVFGTTAYSEALKAVKNNHYFTTFAAAEDYLPVFAAKKWPNADNGSKFNITYNQYQDEWSYIDRLGKLTAYTLTEDDYEQVWQGRGRASLALSPLTQTKLSGLVRTALPDAVTGDMALVSYAYQNSEPEAGSTITKAYGNPCLFAYNGDGYELVTDGTLPEAGDYLLAARVDGRYVPFGFLAAADTAGYCIGSALSAPEGLIDEDSAEIWFVSLERGTTDSTFYVRNAFDQYVSTAASGGPFYLSDTIPSVGAEWLLRASADGTYDMVATLNDKYVKYARNYQNYSLYAASAFASVSVAATHARLYQFNGTAWLNFSTDDATVVVWQPSDYAVLGSATATYVSDPESQLPVWLQLTYPYAEVGTRVAMAYKTSSSKGSASTYQLTENGWKPATAYIPESVTLSKEGGAVTARMSVYYDKSLLGDAGGFIVQDVALDGLNYVWSNTSAYGWKASGYYSSTYHNCESWIVSPAMNFKNAVAPCMQFDHVFRYLLSNTPAEYNERLGVFVTTNFTGDVTTTEWSQIMLDESSMPTNADWNFVTVSGIDLSAYIGGKCWIAFRYSAANTDDYAAAATYEVKNLVVREADIAE